MIREIRVVAQRESLLERAQCGLHVALLEEQLAVRRKRFGVLRLQYQRGSEEAAGGLGSFATPGTAPARQSAAQAELG
jgi:hypothetical protein